AGGGGGPLPARRGRGGRRFRRAASALDRSGHRGSRSQRRCGAHGQRGRGTCTKSAGWLQAAEVSGLRRVPTEEPERQDPQEGTPCLLCALGAVVRFIVGRSHREPSTSSPVSR